ncbi:DUF1343 domain-containing protein [Flavobacteriaceae bacterium]|nr:DUF1343 domain-containing protein [Flavobacteriaceae bacterium]
MFQNLLAKNKQILLACLSFFIFLAGQAQQVKPAAYQTNYYLPLLKNKKIAVVANQTSTLDNKHLVDFLLDSNVEVMKVFAPEHGFRGKQDAGAKIEDGIDTKTRLPILSLYGSNKKPTKDQLLNVDMIVFDIQDVGARFYTYISTLHYVMEAAAESDIPVVLLDRPNPNAHYIDGPVLKPGYESFVGMHPVPVVYGMTIGEYGLMINGEGWLANKVQCNLIVVPIKNYNHEIPYELPIKPSPNLPNAKSINLYPSLCFFEGTPISAGRGTEMQFQIYGAPELNPEDFIFPFTPKPNEGAKYPKFKNQICHGEDLRNSPKLNQIDLSWLIKAYQASENDFFNAFFAKLAGTDQLENQIKAGLSSEQVRATWQQDLEEFKLIRNNYLLYP